MIFMKKINVDKFIGKHRKSKKIILFIITFIILYLALITSLVTQKYNVKEGDIAKVDIKAPREIIDDTSTKARIQQAIESVPLQYNKKTEVKNNVTDDINQMFNKIYQIKDL